jgi:NAD-dependent deacetylase
VVESRSDCCLSLGNFSNFAKKIMTSDIQQLARWLQKSRTTVIMTGAGVSAESGLATFRDAQDGLWADVNPVELASPEGFARNPHRVWQWYQWRRQQVMAAEPNWAHIGIARLQSALGVKLITQNVDGLHQRSGSWQVCELHGNIMQNRCNSAKCDYSEAVTDASVELSLCPRCQSDWLRPSVVWFGESLDPGVIQFAESETYLCDLFLSVGTSSQVYPAAGFAQLAKSRGAQLVEINPNPTQLSAQVDLLIAQPAGQVFKQLTDLLQLN